MPWNCFSCNGSLPLDDDHGTRIQTGKNIVLGGNSVAEKNNVSVDEVLRLQQEVDRLRSLLRAQHGDAVDIQVQGEAHGMPCRRGPIPASLAIEDSMGGSSQHKSDTGHKPPSCMTNVDSQQQAADSALTLAALAEAASTITLDISTKAASSSSSHMRTHLVTLHNLSQQCSSLAAPIGLVVFELTGADGGSDLLAGSARGVATTDGGRGSHTNPHTAVDGGDTNQQLADDEPGTMFTTARSVWCNDAYVRKLDAGGVQEAVNLINEMLCTGNVPFTVEGFCRNVANAAAQPVKFWHTSTRKGAASRLCRAWLWPVKLLDEEGSVSGRPHETINAALLYEEPAVPMSEQFEFLLTAHAALQPVPCMVTVLDMEGFVIMQNPESRARMGYHAFSRKGAALPVVVLRPSLTDSASQSGNDQFMQAGVDMEAGREAVEQATAGAAAPDNGRNMHRADPLSTPGVVAGAINYLEELFYGRQSLMGEMLRAIQDNHVFQDRMQITSPVLRTWFGLDEGDELWHRVQITRMHDPIQERPLLCVCQVDISDVIEVEKQVVLLQQQQASLLREILPQQVIEHLLIQKAIQVVKTCRQDNDPLRRPMLGSAAGWQLHKVLEGQEEQQDYDKPVALSTIDAQLGAEAEVHRAMKGTGDHLQFAGMGSYEQEVPMPKPAANKHREITPEEIREALDNLARDAANRTDPSNPNSFLFAGAHTPCAPGSGLGAPHLKQLASSNSHSNLNASRKPIRVDIDAAAGYGGVPGSTPTISSPRGAKPQRARRFSANCEGLPDNAPWPSLDDASVLGPWAHAMRQKDTPTALQGLNSPVHGSKTRFTGLSDVNISRTLSAQLRKTGKVIMVLPFQGPSHASSKNASMQDVTIHSMNMEPASDVRHPPSPLSEELVSKVVPGPGPTILQPNVLPRVMKAADQTGNGNQDAASTQPSSTLESLSSRAHNEETGSIWLTQQDVMNLATFHEEVTILFADIKGFTSLSKQLHPSQVMLFLNSLYSVWDSLLETFGVYKVETIGDSYMAAAGLFCHDPATNSKKLGGQDSQHASKILAFAKAMLWSSQSIKTPLGEPVNVRVGIHSGPCMSGVVGQRMPRFCLFGDSVNTASRMESNGHPGCIHASDAAHAHLPNEPWVATGGIIAKGKGMMETYLLPVLPGAAALAAAAIAASPQPVTMPAASPTFLTPSMHSSEARDVSESVPPKGWSRGNSCSGVADASDCHSTDSRVMDAPGRATCTRSAGQAFISGHTATGNAAFFRRLVSMNLPSKVPESGSEGLSQSRLVSLGLAPDCDSRNGPAYFFSAANVGQGQSGGTVGDVDGGSGGCEWAHTGAQQVQVGSPGCVGEYAFEMSLDALVESAGNKVSAPNTGGGEGGAQSLLHGPGPVPMVRTPRSRMASRRSLGNNKRAWSESASTLHSGALSTSAAPTPTGYEGAMPRSCPVHSTSYSGCAAGVGPLVPALTSAAGLHSAFTKGLTIESASDRIQTQAMPVFGPQGCGPAFSAALQAAANRSLSKEESDTLLFGIRPLSTEFGVGTWRTSEVAGTLAEGGRQRGSSLVDMRSRRICNGVSQGLGDLGSGASMAGWRGLGVHSISTPRRHMAAGAAGGDGAAGAVAGSRWSHSMVVEHATAGGCPADLTLPFGLTLHPPASSPQYSSAAVPASGFATTSSTPRHNPHNAASAAAAHPLGPQSCHALLPGFSPTTSNSVVHPSQGLVRNAGPSGPAGLAPLLAAHQHTHSSSSATIRNGGSGGSGAWGALGASTSTTNTPTAASPTVTAMASTVTLADHEASGLQRLGSTQRMVDSVTSRVLAQLQESRPQSPAGSGLGSTPGARWSADFGGSGGCTGAGGAGAGWTPSFIARRAAMLGGITSRQLSGVTMSRTHRTHRSAHSARSIVPGAALEAGGHSVNDPASQPAPAYRKSPPGPNSWHDLDGADIEPSGGSEQFMMGSVPGHLTLPQMGRSHDSVGVSHSVHVTQYIGNSLAASRQSLPFSSRLGALDVMLDDQVPASSDPPVASITGDIGAEGPLCGPNTATSPEALPTVLGSQAIFINPAS